jgi:hypothetical protein
MNKTAIKAFAVGARKKLIASVARQACAVLDGTGQPSRALAQDVAQKGFDAVVEQAAYAWFQRIIAVRFMEVNGYLPGGVRVFSLELQQFSSTQGDCAEEDFTALLIAECRVLAKLLPGFFGSECRYLESLLDLSRENGVIRSLVDTVPEEDFRGTVEIVGWLYQYYNEEHKNEVISLYGGRVKREDVPTATRFFTTDWIVRSMVDNSLGKYWLERNPDSALLNKLDFYLGGTSLRTAENILPQNLKLFDPCMGSGHILVYAFDILLEIYKECGYSAYDAAAWILQKNLYGLDIDPRSCQLAYFALMMKARQYNSDIFTQEIRLNLYAIEESNEIDEDFLELAAHGDSQMKQDLETLMLSLRDAREYGSVTAVQAIDFPRVYRRLEEMEEASSTPGIQPEMLKKLFHLLKQAQVMTEKYEIVATNPPYLNKMDKKLKKYVSEYYRDYCSDLFSVFIYKSFDFCKNNGYCAFMSPFVWMFIKTYEKLRKYIIQNKSISSLIQLEYSAFEEATVPICTFVLKNGLESEPGIYLKLSDFKGGMKVQKQKVVEAKNNPNCAYRFEVSGHSFTQLPGIPLAYWGSGKFSRIFADSPRVEENAAVTNGLFTCDNKRFLRRWYEVSKSNIFFQCDSRSACEKSERKWYPYNKGGDFRKWYGNHEYVVNFKNFGSEISKYRIERKQSARFPGQDYYFSPGVSWSFVSSSRFGVRYYPPGFVFDIAGSSVFVNQTADTYYYLGFLSSAVAFEMLNFINPTLNYQAGNIAKLPIRMDESKKPRVDELVAENIALCKSDWDSTELSWNFYTHPLLEYRLAGKSSKISDAFANWVQVSKERVNRLRENEEELNKIFIGIYGLQDELSPTVQEKHVTLHKADLQQTVRSFISYAVGCMFGRYENPAVCTGKTDILLISEVPGFEDDIVSRFISFVRDTYGAETLTENLCFLAQALGRSRNAEQTIRNYFFKKFFVGHVKAFHKRPVYWLLDGGCAKILFDMHSYGENTLCNAYDRLKAARAAISQSADFAELAKEQRISLEKLDDYLLRLKKTADLHIPLDLDDGVQINYNKVQGEESLLPSLF